MNTANSSGAGFCMRKYNALNKSVDSGKVILSSPEVPYVRNFSPPSSKYPSMNHSADHENEYTVITGDYELQLGIYNYVPPYIGGPQNSLVKSEGIYEIEVKNYF